MFPKQPAIASIIKRVVRAPNKLRKLHLVAAREMDKLSHIKAEHRPSLWDLHHGSI
jgi:hypothetical protein